MRGYKTTADGKMTSYFHTDISNEAKELIAKQGFGKPQKLDDAVAAEKASADAKGGGSAWNQAGTYEEKNMFSWVQEQLTSRLKGLKFALPGGKGSIATTDVKDVKGEATISVSRGKRRRLMDVSLVVDFEATVGDGEVKGSGHYVLQDLTADDGGECELETNVDNSTPQSVREVLDAFAKPGGQGLQPLLKDELKKLVAEYVAK